MDRSSGRVVRTTTVLGIALALLTVTLLPVGASAAPPGCEEDGCEIVVDPMECPLGPKEETRIGAKPATVVLRYCSQAGSASSGPALCEATERAPEATVQSRAAQDDALVQVSVPSCEELSPWNQSEDADDGDLCEDWAGSEDDVDDECLAVVTVEPIGQCLGPGHETIEGAVGPVGFSITRCDTPPSGDPVSTTSQADPSCSGWNKAGIGPQGCLVVVNPFGACVGGSGSETVGSVGPVGYRILVCDAPPGSLPPIS